MVDMSVGIDYHFYAPAALRQITIKVGIAFFVVAAVNENNTAVRKNIYSRVCKTAQIVGVFCALNKLKHFQNSLIKGIPKIRPPKTAAGLTDDVIYNVILFCGFFFFLILFFLVEKNFINREIEEELNG